MRPTCGAEKLSLWDPVNPSFVRVPPALVDNRITSNDVELGMHSASDIDASPHASQGLSGICVNSFQCILFTVTPHMLLYISVWDLEVHVPE